MGKQAATWFLFFNLSRMNLTLISKLQHVAVVYLQTSDQLIGVYMFEGWSHIIAAISRIYTIAIITIEVAYTRSRMHCSLKKKNVKKSCKLKLAIIKIRRPLFSPLKNFEVCPCHCQRPE